MQNFSEAEILIENVVKQFEQSKIRYLQTLQ